MSSSVGAAEVLAFLVLASANEGVGIGGCGGRGRLGLGGSGRETVGLTSGMLVEEDCSADEGVRDWGWEGWVVV